MRFNTKTCAGNPLIQGNICGFLFMTLLFGTL
jgi:hypothetical protein